MNQGSVTLSSVDFEQVGRTTIATVRFPDDYLMARLGARPVRPEFIADMTGVGIARCRPEDHYDPDIGRYIAVQRAQRDLADQIERRVIDSVVTERDYQIGQTGERFADAINDLVHTFNRAMAQAGHSGRIEGV